MNFLRESFEQAWKSIKKHPYLLIFLVLFYIALVGISIYLILNYPAQILEDVQGIMEPLENANYNATSIQEGMPFSPELGKVFTSYNSLINKIYYLSLWLAFILIIVQAGIWILTVRIVSDKVEHELKEGALAWGKYLMMVVLFSFLPVIISYLILNTFFNIESTSTATILLWLVLGILLLFYYFGLVGFALIYHQKVWSSWVKITFQKIHFNLAVLLINLAVILLFVLGAYFLMFIEGWAFLALLCGLLLFLTLILTTLFWAGYVQVQLKEHEKDHN